MTTTCDCQTDGFCSRYQRDMGRRMREICAGTNVDLGTAAAFREQWRREATPTAYSGPKRQLLLKTNHAPGDAVAMTAAIYSLHRSYPGEYSMMVESYWPDVFAHNPDVSAHLIPTGKTTDFLGVSNVEMHYPAIHQSNDRTIHFMGAWCEFLASAIGRGVPLLTNKPRIYFDSPEPPVNDFWLVCSGGKRDFTTKLWGQRRYQEVVNLLGGRVNFVQVGGAKPVVPWDKRTLGSQEDSHPRLEGTGDMVGRTTLRQLFDLVRASRGVLCGVSLLMHVAAALDKPAVVVAGGREPVAWNAYPRQQYLHTVGATPCSDVHGRVGGACWRYRTEPLGDGTVMDEGTCLLPVGGDPQCMAMVSPAEVAAAVYKYNQQYEVGSWRVTS